MNEAKIDKKKNNNKGTLVEKQWIFNSIKWFE